MKVQSIEINNFKGIVREKVALHGQNVYVLGKNAKGKTSFLDAIFKILAGDYPKKPTKEGAERGTIKIDLEDIKVICTFNEKDEKVKLTVEAPDGRPFSSPRGLLDSKCGIIDFSIDEFFKKQPKDKIDFLKQLCGIDFTDLDAKYKEAFDDRTFKNRKLKEQSAIGNVFFDKKKTEKKDASTILKQLEEIEAHNERFLKVESKLKQKIQDSADLTTDIEKLEKELEEKQAEKALLDGEIASGNKWIADPKNVKKDITSVKQEMATIEVWNQEVETNLKNQKELDKLKECEIAAELADKKVKEIEETKRRIIKESKLPVEGLTFDDNQVYYNGLPFEDSQINTAQKIIIGLQLNMAVLKDVRIARFEGSLLDDDNIKLVEEWAAENDLQLFVEFVDRKEEGLRIEVKENA